MMQTNGNNPVRISPDPASTRFGNSNLTFQIYDVLIQNNKVAESEEAVSSLFAKFDARAYNISLCTMPISYATMAGHRSDYCIMN